MRSWEVDFPISVALSSLLGCLVLVSYRCFDQLHLLLLQLLHLLRERDPQVNTSIASIFGDEFGA